MDISHEQARVYTWFNEMGAPSMKITQPFSLEIEIETGAHVVTDVTGQVFIVKNWDVCRTEPKGSPLVIDVKEAA